MGKGPEQTLLQREHTDGQQTYEKMINDIEYMSMGPLYVLLGEVSVQVLCPFFNLIVCFPDVESYEFFIYFGV